MTTDANGRYRIKAIPLDSKYTIRAKAYGFAPAAAPAWIFEDQAGRVEVKPLVLQRANLSISGTVRDKSGKPVPNARVNIQGQGQPDGLYVRTDKTGRFTIEGLCQGRVQLLVQYGAGRSNISASAGDKDVAIVLSGLGERP